MVSFIVYDLSFLALFSIFAVILLYKHKKNLKRHGWIFLYHTKVGLKFIDWVAKKFKRPLEKISYFVIASGYALMAAILWLITRSVWTYVSNPIPKQLQNLPPIAPLIPYFPKLFNLESLFPPLYFTYFLIALAIVAVSHEFAHGIFARLWNIKVKTTGLAFFGPFFGAFVEPDEKKMAKAPKKQQLSILAAGTFTNVLMFIVFGLLMWGFFAVSFTPGGLIFNTYAQSIANVSDITMVGNHSVGSLEEIAGFASAGLNSITAGGKTYFAPNNSLSLEFLQKNQAIVVFDDSPALRAGLQGAIASIDNKLIRSHNELSNALALKQPGDVIQIKTIQEDGSEKSYELALGERNGKAYLGVGFYGSNLQGFRGKVAKFFANIKDPNVYYATTWDGGFVQFIYDLLWWIVVINILVALMNMLPVSILDGGRFFYLTMLGITADNEKVAKKTYAIVTWFILLLIIAMMVKWLLGYI